MVNPLKKLVKQLISKRATSMSNKKHKILVVNDEDDVIELLTYALKDDFELITAVDAKEALELTRKVNPDLMITDIYMPILNGLDLIKEINKLSSIPILVISASKHPRNKLDHEHSHVLEKPFSIRQLKEKIRLVLESKPNSLSSTP